MFFKYSRVNDEPATYEVNGKKVTEAEYKEELNKAFDTYDGNVTGGLTAPPKIEVDCPNREPEFKSLGKTTASTEVSYKPIATLAEQIIEQFVEDCYHDKTNCYADMTELDCGMVVMSVVPKDNPKYITTMVFADEEEAAQFCFDVMNGNVTFTEDDKKEEEEK